MMTRETKVGLVVAGSFLCLVGVVVASRMRNDADPEAVAQSVTPKQESPDKPKNGVIPANLNVEGSLPPLPPAAVGKEPNPFAGVSLPQGPEAPKPPQPDLPLPLPNGGAPLPPLSEPSAPKPQASPKLPPPGGENISQEEQSKILKAVADAAKPIIPGKPEPPAAGPLPVSAPSDINLPPLPPGSPPPPVAVADARPTLKPEPSPAAPKPPGALPPPEPTPAEIAKPSVGPGPAPSAPAPQDLKPKGPDGPPTPPLSPAAPVPIGGPAASPAGSPTSVGLPPVGSPAPLPPPEVRKVDPPTRGEGTGALPPAPPVRDLTNPALPPLGAEKTTPTPPISIPPLGGKPAVSPALPQVTSFDVDTYTCRPEDVSFEAVSNRYFRSDKYARALLEYNRKHGLFRENLAQDNPRLQAGQKIMVPPATVLESRYPSLIANRPAPSPGPVTPPAAQLGQGAVAPITIGTPPGATPGASPASRFTPTAASNDPTKRFRVGERGQLLIEIAQQTLGDGRRWSEIYRLNPSLRPEYPIPGGTELRLPASANVP